MCTIERILLDRKMNVADLARRSGVSYSTVHAIVRGDRSFSKLNIQDSISIAKALHVPVEELLDDGSTTIDREVTLSELHAIKLFRLLDKTGQEKAIAYLEDLDATGKYRVNSNSKSREENG